jgi:hypothetical protein
MGVWDSGVVDEADEADEAFGFVDGERSMFDVAVAVSRLDSPCRQRLFYATPPWKPDCGRTPTHTYPYLHPPLYSFL